MPDMIECFHEYSICVIHAAYTSVILFSMSLSSFDCIMFKKSLKQQKKSAGADGGLALSSLSSISESISCSNEKSKLVKKCETQNQL